VEDGIPTTSISGKGNRTSFVGRSSEFVYGDDDDEMESAVASAQDQREEELQVLILLKYKKLFNSKLTVKSIEVSIGNSLKLFKSYIINIL